MYWERYIDRRNPRRIEPLDKPIDTYIMLDTETTGLNPEEGATLIEIGALFVQPGNENSRPKFEQLIDPQHPLTEFITGLTGITDHMLQGMPTAGAAMMRFHQWIDHVWPAGEPLTIIAHNAQFDVSFLDAAERVYDPTSPVFDCKWGMHEGDELGAQPAEASSPSRGPHRRLPHRRRRGTPRTVRRDPGADALPSALC